MSSESKVDLRFPQWWPLKEDKHLSGYAMQSAESKQILQRNILPLLQKLVKQESGIKHAGVVNMFLQKMRLLP